MTPQNRMIIKNIPFIDSIRQVQTEKYVVKS